MMAGQLCARDDSRLVMGRSAHCLCGVEFGILECSKANEARDQRRWQRVTREVDLVRPYDSDRTRQWFAHCWRRLSPRGRGKPRFFVFVDERNTHADNLTRCTCFLDQMFHLGSRHRCDRGQEGPLIRIQRTKFVDELAVARISREPLKGQGNQITEPARRHCILARKKPIVGSESDIGDAFHRVGNKEGSETARQCRRNRLLEKDPRMSTVSGSGPLNGNRYSMTHASVSKSKGISSPFTFIEIRGQKRTSIIREHRIDAHNEWGAVCIGPA